MLCRVIVPYIISLKGYKFEAHEEYVQWWLPELARLPTEWLHHPRDVPACVLQDAAKARLQKALSEMWRHSGPQWTLE
jgi:deoxyribodipyrimidine photolyase